MSTSEPQPILSQPTEAAIFLVVTVRPGSERDVAEVLADAAGLKRSVGFRIPEAELSLVVGIGAGLWDRLGASPRPAGLHPFASSPVPGIPRWPRQVICSSTSEPTASICALSWPRG